MHSIKLKQPFTILLILLFCFYGIWLSQVKAQNASIAKDLEQIPVNNKEEIQSLPVEQNGISLTTLDDRSSLDDIVEDKTPSSDTVDEKKLQENPSINEDNQKFVAEKETSSATSTTTAPPSSPDEEVPFIEEENENQISVSDNKEQGNGFDEENSSFLEEEKPPISHQVNTDERESEYAKEEGISSHVSESFPVTVYEEKTLSEFGIDDNEISGETSPDSEDKQGIVTDKDTLSDVKEKENPSASSRTETSAHSFDERESLVQEKEGTQTPKGFGEQMGTNPDDKSISLLPEEKSPIDFESISSEETDPQVPAREITTSEIQSLPIEQNGISLTTLDDRPSLDIVEGKTPSSATSSITFSISSSDKEVPLIEEEREDRASVADNKQQENAFVEGRTPFSEEERSSISHLINTDEKESHDREGEDISSHVSESFPVTVHENKTLSEFGIEDSEISGETSPVSEDKQGIVTDKDLLSDVKEKETLPITSTAVSSTHSPPEKESLVQEKEDIQTSKVFEEQPGINPNEENISLLQAEKSPIDFESSSNEETDPQESVREKTESEEVKSTWEIWHSDPTHSIILAVVITLIAAKLGGWIAGALGFPGVVGKLILGMILGNIYLLTGSDYFDFLKTMPFLKMLSYFGTLVLLLTAGLHTDLRAIFRVGPSSVLVCLGGMVVPACLGLIVCHFLLPDSSTGSKVLLSIVLCNTSTGLLFAILNELKIMNTIEGRVITGATILTEIIVILSFGIVSGIVVKGGVSLPGISVSFGVAIFLLITAVIIIVKYGEKFGNFLTNRLTEGLNIPIIVILSLLMAFMFGSIGLHTVIGAFIAGLFLRNVKLRNSDDNEHRNVESFIRPFYALLVPILFLRVGAQVDLQSFLNLDAILLGLNITGAAILGKLFCGICPIEKGTNRLLIGFGMAMKLEGTLILAGIGRDVGIFNDTVFSSIIMAIVFTSTICPFLMKKFLLKKNNARYESICIDPGKTELEKVCANKRMRLKIFGFYLI